jgi:DNA-binding CsgD family transcriptional regulator
MIDKTLFISSDMRVVSYHNGIKLLLPHDTHFAAATTVATLLQLHMSVYFLDTEGRTVLINAEGAAVCGFDTPMNSRGKSLLDVSEQQSANSLIDNCRAVIQTGKTKIFEEANQRQDGISMQFLSVKMPWYAEPETVIGVMGVSIVLGKHSLSDALSQLKALGLLNQEKPNYCKINDVQLTQRELQCLQATVQGFTAKEIAQQLGISYRTVEEYLTNIREKAGASSKAELVRMVLGQIDLGSLW